MGEIQPQIKPPVDSTQIDIPPIANNIPPVFPTQTKPRRAKKILLTTILPLLIISAAIAGYYVIKNSNPILNQSSKSDKGCKTTGNIEHCIQVDKVSASITDTLNFTSIITNRGSDTLNKSFGCTDNTPELLINGSVTVDSGLCLTAISEVTIKPGESKIYKYTSRASALKIKENDVSAEWGEAKSGTLKITVMLTEEDNASSQNCSKSSNVVKSCAQVMATLPNINAKQAAEFFKKYNLTLITQISYEGPTYQRKSTGEDFVCIEDKGKPAYSEDLGFYTANVPYNELDSIIEKLKADPMVELASESPGGLVANTKPISCSDDAYQNQ